MSTILVVLLLFVTLAMIGVILIQRSEGGGLGIGSTQGMGSFMSGRGTANLLTRTTSILAAVFFIICLVLALINRGTVGSSASILNAPQTALPTKPAPNAPVVPAPVKPGVPTN